MRPKTNRPVETGMESAGTWHRQLESFAGRLRQAYILALRVAGDADVAEEAVQEALSRLVARPPEDFGERNPMGYFFKAVRRTALELKRKMRRRERREGLRAMALTRDVPTPEDAVSRGELASAARAALESLGRAEREAVSLLYEQNVKRVDAAEILDCCEQTVSDRAIRGLRQMRSRLAAQGFAAAGCAAIGSGLRELGMPAPPVRLTAFFEQLKENRWPALLKGRSGATRKMARRRGPGAGSSMTGVLAAVIVAGLVATGVLLVGPAGEVRQREVPDRPVRPAPAARETGPKDDSLMARWTFDAGPADELKALSGGWKWKASHRHADGVMLARSGIVVPLPVRLTAEPTVVESRTAPCGESNVFRQHNCWLGDKRVVCADKAWARDWGGTHPGDRFTYSIYFLGEHAFFFAGDRMLAMKEFEKPCAGHRPILSFRNWAVDEIRVRKVAPEEMPGTVRDVGAAKASMMELKPKQIERLLKAPRSKRGRGGARR